MGSSGRNWIRFRSVSLREKKTLSMHPFLGRVGRHENKRKLDKGNSWTIPSWVTGCMVMEVS